MTQTGWTRLCIAALIFLGIIPTTTFAGPPEVDLFGGSPGPAIEVRPALESSGAGVLVSRLSEQDRVLISGPSSLAIDRSSSVWQPRAAGHQMRWQLSGPTASEVVLPFNLSDLPVATEVVVSVQRARPDGSTAQISRALVRQDDGVTVLGPTTETLIRRMVRLTPRVGSMKMAPGLEIDSAGRLIIAASDPRYEALAAEAALVEPSIRAVARTVSQTTAADSVTGYTDQDRSIEYLCSGGVYAGTGLTIDEAPFDATITSFDVGYWVYHPADISRFKVGLFRNSGSFVNLYNGLQTGDTWLIRTHEGMSHYDGDLVNAHYTLGTCARVAIEGGYLDYWAIILYYDAGSSSNDIDLIADSLAPAAGSVEAGTSINIDSQGRVQGTGSVGGSFSIGYYLSNDNNITTADTLLSTRTESSADTAGDTFGENGLALDIPGGTSAGTYYLGMIVDPPNAITESNESNNVAWSQITVTEPVQATCTPSNTALCLNNDRFRVTASYRTQQGDSGAARAVSMTGETGYFWFFSSDNVEVVVKVVNGCGFNSSYWVFAAGLTNVEVDLVVEDTQEGIIKPYNNPLNQSFNPIQDTRAFATCP